uniref:Uncharacterized protein n=1 Tax=Hemiselmis andersenii TaxID=464988 RepID=A0A6T8IYC8_HEMAN|mmetsp:Transcript_19790/g.45392  ORF Transcript_19790/g.45392 Transcript_19790/m.45392 type:complete len:178 (+) Transcript_19790:19-552(+)
MTMPRAGRLLWVRPHSSFVPRLGRVAGVASRVPLSSSAPRRQPSRPAGAVPMPSMQTLWGGLRQGEWGRRSMCLSAEAYKESVDDINSQFAEARLLIEDALDSQGTTYFEEDLDDAQVAVKECLALYQKTLAALDDQRRGEMTRSMGMKMEQLKGELAQIMDSLTNDEDLPPAKGDA